MIISFKPYKGVSSNVCNYWSYGYPFNVSNPIREYLQMRIIYYSSFKPYKGVSSNTSNILSPATDCFCFKPYKGVSSNIKEVCMYLAEAIGFKPYKGVSSNKALK